MYIFDIPDIIAVLFADTDIRHENWRGMDPTNKLMGLLWINLVLFEAQFIAKNHSFHPVSPSNGQEIR